MTPFEQHRQRQARARLERVRPEADAALAALGARGVKARLIGSLANDRFKLHSDVDILILDAAGFSDGRIYDIVTDHVKSAPVDLVFADRQSPESLELLVRGRPS
jgi:predicted nucleotidyltransferase